MGMKDVVEKRLVEPDGAERAGAIANQQLEDLESTTDAATPGRSEAMVSKVPRSS
jgi:hypothetical protein